MNKFILYEIGYDLYSKDMDKTFPNLHKKSRDFFVMSCEMGSEFLLSYCSKANDIVRVKKLNKIKEKLNGI